MSAPSGQKVLISIYGREFNQGTEAYLNSVKQTIKSLKSTSITLELDLTSLKTGTYPLYLKNGNKQSETVHFYVESPLAPIIQEVRPAATYQSTSPVSVSIYGKNFSSQATLTVKGSKVAIQSISSTKITFAIPFPYPLFTPNSKNEIKVTNPDGKSAVGYIYVLPSNTPLISYISPRTIQINRSSYIYAYGSNLRGGTLYFDGKSVRTYSYSSTYVRTYYSYNVGKTPRKIEIKVLNSGKYSNPVYLEVTGPPAPEIYYLNPPYGKAGTNANITISGRYFSTSPKASVIFGNKTYSPTSVSSQTISLSLSLKNLNPGVYPIQIKNGDGKLSNKVYFTVTK